MPQLHNKEWLYIVGFIIVSILIYSPGFFGGLVSDDLVLIEQMLNYPFLGIVTDYDTGLKILRPVIWASYFLNYRISGLDSWSYYLLNIISHGINGWLVYHLSKHLIEYLSVNRPRLEVFSLFCGGLFVVLPSHGEAVMWISGRTDILAFMFGLVACLYYIQYRKTQTYRKLVVSLLFMFLGLLSKESIIVLPAIFIIYDLYRGLQESSFPIREWLFSWAIITIAFGLYLSLRYIVLGEFIGGYSNARIFYMSFGTIIDILVNSIRIFLPAIPSLIYVREISQIQLFIIIIVLVCSIFVVVTIRDQRWFFTTSRSTIYFLSFLTIAYSLSILPVISLFWRGIIFFSEGERFLYFPSTFACIALGFLLQRLVPPRFFVSIFTVICAIYGIMTWHIANNWREAGIIYQQIVTQTDVEALYADENALIVGVPDQLGAGAFVMRNSVFAGLRLFQQRRSRFNAKTIIDTRLEKPSDCIHVTMIDYNKYRFTLSNPNAYFTITSSDTKSDDIEVSEIFTTLNVTRFDNGNRHQLASEFVLIINNLNVQLWYYTGQKLSPVSIGGIHCDID